MKLNNINSATGFDYPIYQLDCVDHDINKNGEITYELLDLTLRKLSKSGAMANEISLDELDVNPSVVTDYFLNSKIFKLSTKSGQLFLNMSGHWINLDHGENDTLDNLIDKKFQILARNSMLILKLRVNDNAIVPFSNVYNLKFRFCFSKRDQSEEEEKYCYNSMYDESEDESGEKSAKGIKLKPILNLDIRLLMGRDGDIDEMMTMTTTTTTIVKNSEEDSIDEVINVDDSESYAMTSESNARHVNKPRNNQSANRRQQVKQKVATSSSSDNSKQQQQQFKLNDQSKSTSSASSTQSLSLIHISQGIVR